MSNYGHQTNEHSIQTLCKVIVGKLENAKMIEFNAAKRNDLRDALGRLLNNFVYTEASLSEKIRGEIASKTQNIQDADITETEAFKMRKRALKTELEDNAVAGFYLRTSLKDLSAKIGDFFLQHSLVEEVFASDDDMRRLVLECIANFDESKIA